MEQSAPEDHGIDDDDEVCCPHCGKSIERPQLRSMPVLVREFLEETFEADGKLPRTLRTLFLKPGQLTTEYIAGNRGLYTRPLRLYLFFSAIYILTFSILEPVDYVGQATEGVRLGMKASGSSTFADTIDMARYSDMVKDAYNTCIAFAFFISIPISTVPLRLLYRRTHPYFEEHFVFLMHATCVSFLVATLLTPLMAKAPLLHAALTVILSQTYIVLAMKRHYAQPWPATLAKCVALMVWSMFVSCIAGGAAVIVALLIAMAQYMMT